MLVIQSFMVISFFLRVWALDSNYTVRLYMTMVQKFSQFLLTIVYYSVILKFTTNFRLQTMVSKDG